MERALMGEKGEKFCCVCHKNLIDLVGGCFLVGLRCVPRCM